MKNEKFLELMSEIDEELLERARTPKKNKPRRSIWISAIAACLALCITLGAIFGWRRPAGTGGNGGDEGGIGGGFDIEKAIMPETGVSYAPFYEYYGEHGGIREFYKASIAEMLRTEEGTNTVYSPANVYMALAMLAETTGGESRAQILSLLGAEDISEVREMAEALWMLSYEPGEKGTTMLANSIWFRSDYTPVLKENTVKTLAEKYRVSTYSGRFLDEAYVAAMKDWVHEYTNGFLKDLELDWEMDEDTAFEILSTIYFKDGWKTKFGGTRNMTFYPTDDREGIICEFLASDKDEVIAYGGEKFIAIRKPFASGGSMLFVLPDRGYTTDDLLCDEEFLRFIADPDAWEDVSYGERSLRIPKFDISREEGIEEQIQNLGITDVFDGGKADFTPLVGTQKKPNVREINHGVRIAIDEKGCEAAGYTQIGAADVVTGGIPKLVKFDRPFIFSVLTEEGIPLFRGIINNPTLE